MQTITRAERAKRKREAQAATAFYAKGPYTAHAAITCAVVRGPADFYQTTSTIIGAHRLAELLNHAHKIASEYPSDVVCNTTHDAPEIIAHATAKALGWRLELPSDRKQRLEWEAEDAARLKLKTEAA